MKTKNLHSSIMADHDDHQLSGNNVLSPACKTNRSQGHPHLKDNFGARDRHTASPDSINADHDNNPFLDEQFHKNPIKNHIEILQPVPVSQNADPVIAALIAAFNQTNSLILQQIKRMGALERKRSRSSPRRYRGHNSSNISPP